MDKSIRNLYTKKNWYKNTYQSLGSEWLIKTLYQLDLPKGYVFVNVSANAGYYEKDAYEAHKEEYQPRYYIGDLYASSLTDKKVDSYEDFKYLDGDNDAACMDVSIIPDKADVVLDCKGALWYCLRSGSKKSLISLIDNYISLLKDDKSILVLDYYKYKTKITEIKNELLWIFVLQGNRRSKMKIQSFGECSTYKLLSKFIAESKIDELFTYLNVCSYEEEKPLAAIMNTMFIRRCDLVELKKLLQSLSGAKYMFRQGIVLKLNKILPYLILFGIMALLGVILYYAVVLGDIFWFLTNT